jgi:DEAD/DEAH box helicase domain-containing protein
MSPQGLTVDVVRDVATECGLEIAQSLILPKRPPKHLSVPSRLHREIAAQLTRDYPMGLYKHQSLALESLLNGNDVALSTSTASGKSLVFITAAIDILLKDPNSKVLALYPAKALIRDQIEKWDAATRPLSINIGYIDGTVTRDRRDEILKANRVVLMTPDVAHAWFMSNLRERHIASFRNSLRLLILDEAHTYEGVFGTNMAYFLRRLDAVSGTYQVLCSTATLGRPSDFVYQLTGRHTVAIAQDQDGSSAPYRHVLLAKDPGYDHLVDLLKRFAGVEGARFLAFSDSRKMVEQIVAATMRVENAPPSDEDSDSVTEPKDLPSSPGAAEAHRILPFRAGYEVEDAKEIQFALWRGKLGGVVSTSAMELGIDIGEIDLVVLLGIPPSLKAFWQRLGRAGRKRDGVCLVIDTMGAITGTDEGLSNYINKELEPSWLYLENRYLQYANVLCAALECSELGFSAEEQPFNTLPPTFKRLLENELNPTEIVPADLYPLKQRAQAGPHREFPLRSGMERDFKVKDAQGLNLGNVTFPQMLREAYPGAIYYYMARPYRVIRMDMRDGSLAVRRERYWTTKAHGNTMVFPRFNGGVLSLYGTGEGFLVESELQVSERVSGFQEMRGRTKLPVQKYGPASPWYRRELTRFFETTGVCWYFPTHAAISEDAGQRIVEAFCLDFGVQERDLGVGLFHAKQTPFGAMETCQGLCIYDAVNGSLRLTQRLAENFSQIVRSAAAYAQAEGVLAVVGELESLHHTCCAIPQVAVAAGNTVEHVGGPDNWTETIAPGEKAMYTCEDGSREVTVKGYRFTPKGLMYELVPERDQDNGRWMVAAQAIQSLHGFTKIIWVDLVTGDERDSPPDAAISAGA